MDSERLLRALDDSIIQALGGGREAAVAYSGGVDSALIAHFAARHCEIVRYTCGTIGSKDFEDAGSRGGGGRAVTIILDDEDVRRLCTLAVDILGDHAPTPISYTVPVLGVVEAAKEKIVLVGNGADELFAGYAKYSAMADPSAHMKSDLGKMLAELERLNRHLALTGKRIEAPFARNPMVRCADGVPLDRKIGPSGRKLVLREAAKGLGLPEHDRPKKAAQYSSGVLKAMERSAKGEGKTLVQWTAGLRTRASP